jgi:predicted GNAT superfamily acetyltransferase
MSEIRIRKAKESDVDTIVKLSDINTIKNVQNSSNGFLVSGYQKEKYIAYIDDAQYFYVATIDEKIVGVLLAFDDSVIKPDEQVNNIIKYSLNEEFVLLKQIFVNPEYKNKGIASKLYKHFYKMIDDKLYIACAIVNEPVNYASIKFHEKEGFAYLLDVLPQADFDGVIRKRTIWIKKPKSQVEEVRLKINSVDKSEIKNILLSNLQNTTALYTHEDNLNWTKLGMLVTFVFALSAGFSHYYEKNDPTSTLLAFLVLLLGFGITYLFGQKIKSGLMYMNSHKENVKRIENRLQSICPNYVRTIAIDNKKIANQSTTSNIMNMVPLISYAIWSVLFILLVFK